MSYLRFQHVFAALMVLSALCAFAIPARYAGRFQPQIQWIFAPVSKPVRSVAAKISNVVAPVEPSDHRAAVSIARENEQLRERNAELLTQIQQLKERDLQFSKLGELRDHCRLVTVVGSDSGSRESLALGGSSLQGVREGMWVISEDGPLVGRVMRSGVAGAQVRLITDPGSRVRVKFFHHDEQGKGQELAIPGVLAEGIGDGKLIVRLITLEDIGRSPDRRTSSKAHAVLHEGDFAILSDGDCPALLQGKFVGRVLSIAPHPGARLFADITLETTTSLKRLPEVLVMTTEE